jgi:hypothetical protein
MERRGTQRREILIAGVKTFRGEGKARQARDYVAMLIRDVDPSVLVLEERTGGHGRTEAKQCKEGEMRRAGDHKGGKAKERREREAHRKRRPEEQRESRAGDTFADKLYEFIGKAAKGSNVQLRLHSATHIKRSLCGDESATWYQVEQVVTEQYGELKGYLCDKGTEREKYWRG